MYIASYGLIVGTNYLVGFILLAVVYYKILKRIKRMRQRHGWCQGRGREEEKRGRGEEGGTEGKEGRCDTEKDTVFASL